MEAPALRPIRASEWANLNHGFKSSSHYRVRQKDPVSRETQAAKKRHTDRVGRVPVDATKIRSGASLTGPWIPDYYEDLSFICKDCGSQEVWTASQQKWWYEVAGGLFEATAIRCRSCRATERKRKQEARHIHQDGIRKKKSA